MTESDRDKIITILFYDREETHEYNNNNKEQCRSIKAEQENKEEEEERTETDHKETTTSQSDNQFFQILKDIKNAFVVTVIQPSFCENSRDVFLRFGRS